MPDALSLPRAYTVRLSAYSDGTTRHLEVLADLAEAPFIPVRIAACVNGHWQKLEVLARPTGYDVEPKPFQPTRLSMVVDGQMQEVNVLARPVLP
jgi:hypothetical protein